MILVGLERIDETASDDGCMSIIIRLSHKLQPTSGALIGGTPKTCYSLWDQNHFLLSFCYLLFSAYTEAILRIILI